MTTAIKKAKRHIPCNPPLRHRLQRWLQQAARLGHNLNHLPGTGDNTISWCCICNQLRPTHPHTLLSTLTTLFCLDSDPLTFKPSLALYNLISGELSGAGT